MNEIINKVRDFNRFYVNLIGLLKNGLFDLEYSLTESRIIFEVDAHKEITARKLKEILVIDEGYLSRLVNNLVKGQIVAKGNSETDKRVYNLSLTEKGQSLIKLINSKSDEQIKNLLQKLDSKDQHRIAEILTELKEILSRINSA